ncbi:MAG TPA: T9SS type A sorting domain-containing protein [Bacteroidia bacterium]|nr:T9SS type A sorting domain-containing protein [Bacteroidia bacterium]
MKKNLLLALGIGIGISASAQTQQSAKLQDKYNSKLNKQDGFNFSAIGQQRPNFTLNSGLSNRAVTKNSFTGSRNAYGLIVTESNCLTANQQLNAVMFTHRISSFFTLPNDNNGYIQNTFSTNYGATWDSLIQTSDPVNLCRYPSGAIYNPSGNTDINNAFATVSGPITSGSGWIGNYFSSAKLDSTNITPIFNIDGASGVINQGFARIGATATDLKTVVTGGLYADPNATGAAAGYRGATLNYATPNGNTFTWTVDSLKPNWLVGTDGTFETFSITQTAWNKAGNIGYVIFCGVDASITDPASKGFAPIVYKTTDAGATWNQLPNFNFSSIPTIAATLDPSWVSADGDFTGTPKAWFTQDKGFDCAVDENGNLHIFCTVLSGFTMSDDSLGYTFAYNAGASAKTFYMFDTYTTGSSWDATMVDSLNTDNAEDFSPFTDDLGAPFPIDARMQMSRSDDGSKLFYYWLDTDPDLNEQLENNKPNIFGKGYDVTNQKWTNTKKFTEDGINYFMYISNISLQSGTLYKTPGTVSLPFDWPNTVDLTQAMRHFFVNGLEFDQSEFVNVKNIGSAEGFDVSANMPNPFNQQTAFNINLTETAHVTVDIVNTLGTTVATLDKGNLVAGSHKVVIDGTDLASGLYFYTVKAGNKSVTRKMMVKK